MEPYVKTLQNLRLSSLKDVSIKEGLDYDAVEGVLNRHVKSSVNWESIKQLNILGIDEVSLKKGHQYFVTIVTSRVEGKVILLGILEGRKKEDVIQFFRSIPVHLRKTVKEVCSDMYDGFINAAKEVFGSRTKVVADRFHVAKLYRKGTETLRKKEMKRLKKECSEKEYKSLKGVLWMLRKSQHKLTDKEEETLSSLFQYSPDLKVSYELQNELTMIFETKLSKGKSKSQIKRWTRKVIRSKLTCFNKFLGTLNKRMDEITNYFIGRNNSGFVEGFNNKIKVIKRRCYGIFNLENLFKRIYLDTAGYSEFI